MGHHINLEGGRWSLRKLVWGLSLALSACAPSEERALDLAAQAQAQAEAGDLPGARRLITKAVGERDDIAEIYLLKGQLDLKANSYFEAYNSYSQVLTLDAVNLEALRAVSELALSLGHPEEAAETANRLLAIAPGDRTGLFVRGMADLQRRAPQAAEASATAILKASPLDPFGLILKARVLYFRGQTAEAIAVLERGAGGSRADALARTAIELYRADRRPASLLRALDEHISRHPDQIGDQIDRVNVYYKIGAVDKARAAGRRIMAVPVAPDVRDRMVSLWYANDADPFPNSTWGAIKGAEERVAVSRFYLLERDFGKAAQIVAQVGGLGAAALRLRIAMERAPADDLLRQADAMLSRDRTQCDALVARSVYARSRGRPAQAARDAAQAVAECPEDTGAVLELAAAARGRSDTAAEFRAYDDALDRDPQNFPVARAYVDRSIQSGNGARAVAAARRLTRAAPAAPAGWAMLVRACRAVADRACATSAQRALGEARTSLFLDPRPGAPDAVGPLGKLTR